MSDLPPGPHGILAHYFHSPTQRPAQGSLSAEDFDALLDAYGTRLISAPDWLDRAQRGTLTDEVCVTFDDGLREAADIALPVLNARKLTACWNVYTGPYVGVPNEIEHWRWLRNYGFGGIEGFYRALWDIVLPPKMPPGYLDDYGYLSDKDRRYRYWRNHCVTAAVYASTLQALARRATPWPGLNDPWAVWLSPGRLGLLADTGHVIGFHSHSHPTSWADSMSDEQWALEYATSRDILNRLVYHPIDTMSHPCGFVPPGAEDWLRAHGIRLAWGATMKGDWPYNVPRWSTGYWRR